jgi:hypothetical protein
VHFIPTKKTRPAWVVRVIAAVALALSMTAGATSSCGNAAPSSSSTSTKSAAALPVPSGGMAAGMSKCKAAVAAAAAADIIDHCCTVGTSVPKAGMPSAGLVGAHTITDCMVTPEIYNIEVYLEWDLDGDGEYEIVDQCSQYEPEDLNQYCTVATSCKEGYYEVVWWVQVSINGVEASQKENGGDYRSKVTRDECNATRHT